ncbi:MFS transporter [Rhodococcus sp. LB1]|uniref:MFS transporter n=1 Tax=Rhodococcus sp. LB1 TaxID=1807499 RepID=UPI0009ED0EEB|nr:MFS transporter [Rhodococcus sp. LB1]RYF59033.1 MAG: MFS transporter [Comamonadaceae bacterium]
MTTLSTHRVYPWVVVGLLTVLMVVNFIDKVSFGLAATELIEHKGLTMAQYGIINSLFFFAFSLTALAVGYISDRFSPKWIIAILVAIWGISQISVTLAGGFATLLIARVALGAAEGPIVPLINHAAYGWLPNRDRSLASSIMTAGGSIGVLVGAPLVTYLIVEHGWHSAFNVTGIISIAFCILWMALGRDAPGSTTRRKTETVDPRATSTNYWPIVRSRSFIGVVVASFAAYWVVGTALAYKPMYLQKVLSIGPTGIAQITVATQLFTILVAYLGQGLLTRHLLNKGISSRIARGGVGGVSLTISALSHLGVVTVNSPAVQVVLVCLTHLSSAVFAISLTVCGEIAPTAHRGKTLGIFGMLYPTAGIIAPLIAAALTSKLGIASGLQAAWLLSGGICIVGALAAFVLIQPERDRELIAERLRPKSRYSEVPPTNMKPISAND